MPIEDSLRRPPVVRLAIVVPVFNEAAVIGKTTERLRQSFATLDAIWQVVFVNDGSSDASPDILEDLAREESRFAVIHLARNFGHQMAVTAGLDFVDCDAAIVMDADLQDPPEIVAELLDKFRGGADVVLAVRRNRAGDGWFKRWTAAIFYWLIKQGDRQSTGENAGDFRLYSRRALLLMRAMREEHRYLRGMSDWTGLKRAFVEFDRQPRAAGQTKYTIAKMVGLAWTAFLSFSGGPVKLLAYMAAGLVLGGVLVALLGPMESGLRFILGSLWGLAGVLLGAISLLGDYLVRIYREAKQRPLYWVDRTRNLIPPENLPARAIVLPQVWSESQFTQEDEQGSNE